MKKNLKNKKELFQYLMHGYIFELEDVATKNGIQKRLKDNELAEKLKEKTKEDIKVKNLFVELKLGPTYNRTEKPWIQIFSTENKSGTKGRYVGISFARETNEVKMWIGFGRNLKKQHELLEKAKEYKMKYSLIEPNLKYNFQYTASRYDAIFIEKKIDINNFKEQEFDRDLKYITDLYKAYEVRFENATTALIEEKDSSLLTKNKINYEELNLRMLTLIEEVGNLAKAIKGLEREQIDFKQNKL